VREALGREQFADALRDSRGWRRFALEQYRLAGGAHPGMRLRWKMLSARVSMALWGDERENLTQGRRARVLLSLGQPRAARALSGTLWRHHPLRLDALAIWLGSWAPRALMARLKQLKRRLSHG
jgi:hypothetical protein